MSYHRPPPGKRPGSPGGRAMGDVAAPSSPVADLAAQVNRFGPQAPTGYQFVTTPFPLATGNVPQDLALVAVTIYQRRATDAFNQFHDAGSEAAITLANQGFANPVAFLAPRMGEVTSTIAAFADSLGIPPAAGASSTSALGDSSNLLLLAAAVAALLWLAR